MLLVVVLLSAWVIAAVVVDARGATSCAASDRFDAIVVLGCRVWPDGSPSDSLRRRARLAAELFHAGHAPRVITTGGVGEGTTRSEADAAASVLTELGVPRDRIALEERSTSTEENARFAAETDLGSASRARRVLVVTDRPHALRAGLVFRRHFESVATAGAIPVPTARARGALREVPVLAWYAARGWL